MCDLQSRVLESPTDHATKLPGSARSYLSQPLEESQRDGAGVRNLQEAPCQDLKGLQVFQEDKRQDREGALRAHAPKSRAL